MKITVAETGLVGLGSGFRLGEVSNDGLSLNFDGAQIGRLQEGGMPIHKPCRQELASHKATQTAQWVGGHR